MPINSPDVFCCCINLQEVSTIISADPFDDIGQINRVAGSSGNTKLGVETIKNGDFSIGSDLVLNGNFGGIGSDVVINGDFATSGSWIGTNTISGGQLTKTSGGLTYQSYAGLSVAKSWKVVVDVAEKNGSGLTFYFGTSIAQTPLDEGVNTLYLVNGTVNLYMGVNNGDGSIINSISVKELGEDWTLGTGWSIGDDRAVFTGASDVAIYQASVTSVNSFYKVGVEVLANEGTSANTVLLGTSEINATHLDVGVHTLYGQALGNAILYIFGRANDELSITNVTAQELGEGWSVGTGWSLEEDKAVASTTGTTASLSQLPSPITGGKSYEISIDVTFTDTPAVGELQIEFGGGVPSIVANITESGNYKITGDWVGSGSLILYALGTSRFSVTNISLQEITPCCE